MLNLSKDICLKFKEARKAKGLNQSALARAVGCQQSAISMFEGGMVTKLSDDTVRKLSEFLGVPLEEQKADDPAPAVTDAPPPEPLFAKGYCPNCKCPSNVPYVVEGHLFFRPMRQTMPAGAKYCPHCGELLELRCPVCGAPLNDGACCAVCGNTYVTNTLPEELDSTAYAKARRAEILELRQLSGL